MADDMTDTNVQSGSLSTGAASTLVNIFAAPREAFAALAVRPTALLPILALVILNVALVLWYYSVVDIAWLIETLLEASGREVPAELAGEGAAGAAAAITTVMAAVATALQILALLLVIAGYLWLVSLLMSHGLGFKRCLTLAAWSSMPTLLGVLSAAVNLAVSDASHMLPTELNPLSFGNLFGIDSMGGGMLRTMLLVRDPTAVWALALMVIGHSQWTGRSSGTSFAIIAGPVIVLCGLGLLLALM